MLIRTGRINLRLRHYGPFAAVTLYLFMLYFPWGYTLHTRIAVPTTLGWVLFGGALLITSWSRLNFFRSSLLFSSLLALLLPVFWMHDEADIWRTIPGLIAMGAGVVILSRLGAVKLSGEQANKVGGAVVTLGLFCTVSVFIRYFLPELHAAWLPFAGGGWATGGQLQPDLMATFLATSLLVAFHSGLLHKNFRAVFYIAAISFALALCQSQTGWLTLLLPVLLMSFTCTRGRRSYPALVLPVMLTSGTAGMCWLALVNHAPVLRDFPWLTYWQNIKAALALLSVHPLSGTGYGHLEAVFPYGVIAAGLSRDYHPVAVVDHVSPEPLFWISEGGVVSLIGVLLLLLWFVKLFHRLWVQVKIVKCYGDNGSDALGWGLCALPILLHTLTGAPWYYSPLHYLLCICLMGMALARTPETEQNSLHFPGRNLSLRVILFIFGLGIMWYSVTSTLVAVGVQDARQNHAYDITRMQSAVRLNPWAVPDTVLFIRAMHQLQMFRKTEDLSHLRGVEAAFKNYLLRHPDPNVYSLLITILDKQNKQAGAEEVYRQAQKIFPRDQRYRVDPDEEQTP